MIARTVLVAFGWLRLSPEEQQTILELGKRYLAGNESARRSLTSSLQATLSQDTSGTEVHARVAADSDDR